MVDPIVSAMAVQLASELMVAASRLGLKTLSVSDRTELRQAITRATTATITTELPAELEETSSFFTRLITDDVITEMVVQAAFAGEPADAEQIRQRLDELGYDEHTSPVDLPAVVAALTGELTEQLRRSAAHSQSSLFNRLTVARLDRLQTAVDILLTEQTAPREEVRLPAPPALLIGRGDDLAAVHRLLRRKTAEVMPRIITRGWPGVGKSSLAATIAHDAATWKVFPDGVLWAALNETPDVRDAVDRWCRQLGAEPHGEDTLEWASARLAGLLRHRRTLLIIDDVWAAAHAQPLLAGGPGCAALVTTRLPEVARELAVTGDDTYLLGVLGETDALDLMEHVAGPELVDRYRAQITELVNELEGLPLALHVAGRLLATDQELGWDVTDLLAELRDSTRLLTSQAPVDRADLSLGTTPTVAALLARSTDRLPDHLRTSFALLGALREKPASFSADALAALWDLPNAKGTIRQLTGRGLLEPAGTGRYQVHALLLAHAQNLLSAS